MKSQTAIVTYMSGEKSQINGKVHVPVLLGEVLQMLDPKQGEFFIDATFGAGGHSEKILERIGNTGKLMIVDWDWHALQYASAGSNVISVNNNFALLPNVIRSLSLPQADGLLLDLGLSSEQLEVSRRGFSFQRAEPLFMTYDPAASPVGELLQSMSERELAAAIRELSGERYASVIAKTIKDRLENQLIETSFELAEIIRRAVGKGYEKGRIDPATRTFMALRMLANKELENLEKLLTGIPKILKPGGRVAIISFHSLEDRLVKQYFRDYANSGILELINKKPIVASREEIRKNPRARSAKLRGAIQT